MSLSPIDQRVTCPSCGGAGGGPFGRAGSAWDDEEYVCPRCKGAGMIALHEPISHRPGIVKASLAAEEPSQSAEPADERKATG